MDRKPQLVITMGLPYSGKSTHCKSLIELGWTVLCPDEFRYAIYGQEFLAIGEAWVWAAVTASARALLRLNHSVIIDATNTHKAARSTWVKMAKEFDIQLQAVVFNTPIDECKRRAMANNADHMVPVITRMADQWEPIENEEDIFVWTKLD